MKMQYTEDTIISKDIVISQPVSGYRFAVDAVLLAKFIRCNLDDELLEIGAGSGVVTILVASTQQYRTVAAMEIQPELADLCRKNFLRNQVPYATVYEADIKDFERLFSRRRFDLIYSNPPYRKVGSGRLNPSLQKAIARHEIKMNLENMFLAADHLLKDAGRMTVILPSFRETDFVSLVNKFRFHSHEWKYVHSFSNQSPAFFVATVGRKPVELIEHTPLVIYEKPGEYTAEMKALLTECRGGS